MGSRKNVLYARVSTSEQNKKGLSIGEQVDDIQDFARREGVIIDENYIDRGKSGTNVNRPELQRMFKEIAAGKIETIYIKYANRLVRSSVYIESFRKVFDKYDVKIISINEDWAGLHDTSDRQMTCNIIGNVDASEPKRAKKRTTDGLRKSAMLGNWAVTRVPLGFKKEKNPMSPEHNLIKPLEEWREVIDIIVKKIIDDQATAESIANYLNSINALDRKWTGKVILKIATKPEYYGGYDQKYYQNLEGTHHSGFYDRKTHDEIDKIIHGRRKEKKYTYLFKQIARCDRCGSILTCDTTLKKVKRNNVSTNQTYLYYYCEDCNTRINETKLLPQVLFEYENKMMTVSEHEERDQWMEKLKRIRKKRELLEEDYANLIIDFDYYLKQRNMFTGEMKKLKETIDGITFESHSKFMDLPKDVQRKLIRENIKLVTVDCSKNRLKSIKVRSSGI